MIKGLITPITKTTGIESNPDDRGPSFEQLNLGVFYKVEGGCVCWIYPRNQLMPLYNIERITLLNWANLYFLLGDEELAQPAPPPPLPHLRASSSSQMASSSNYTGLHAIVQSIQEDHACLLAYI